MVRRGVYHELVKPIGAHMTALEAADIQGRRERASEGMLARIGIARDRVDFLRAVLESLREQIGVTAVMDSGARVVIRFIDQGCGMGEEGVAEAFKLFTSN
jgi:hypothetical protein